MIGWILDRMKGIYIYIYIYEEEKLFEGRLLENERGENDSVVHLVHWTVCSPKLREILVGKNLIGKR